MGNQVERGKALTTYDDFSRGVLEAVEVAAERFDFSVEDLLAQTRLFINGTTVVTNTITQLRGSRVGVLITSGFKDAFRFAGGPRTTELDDHLQVNVPDLMDRRAIAEIDERVDWSGTVLVPIDLDGASRPPPSTWSRTSASTPWRSASSGATPTARTRRQRRRRSRSSTRTSSSPSPTASSRLPARPGAGPRPSSTPSSRTKPTST